MRRTHPVSWYRERVYTLGDEYEPTGRQAALEKNHESGGKDRHRHFVSHRASKTVPERFRKEITDRPFAELNPVSPEKIVGFLSGLRKGHMSKPDDSHFQ